MSGIVAILHEDGSAVDRGLIERLAESMAFRGPDGRRVELVDNVGLGHALLETGFESALSAQPLSLDGEAWICGDARLDDRETLRQRLEDEGRSDLGAITDAELVLRAYRTWDVECLGALLGDFSFVIWDRPKRRLVCVRDRFGVKPLFYARVGGAIVVGNTLDTLRLHPDVSDELDELAIADYLLFSFHQDPAATDLADVRRLPAGHALIWERGELSTDRYWTMPAEGTLRYRDDREYLEHFNEIFEAAVRDRLRAPRVAVRMSGGLDSTAVAAAAVAAASKSTLPCQIRAFTGVFQQLIPDQEGPWARTVAEHLGIPIRLVAGDSDEDLRKAAAPAEEPRGDPLSRAVAEFARVALTGFGGDPANRGSSGYYLEMLRTGQLGGMLGDIRSLLREGKRPPLLVRTLWKHWRSRKRLVESYPGWMDRDLEKRLDLRSRWRRISSREPIGWSIRTEVTEPYWPFILSSQDPGETGLPVDHRHPFFDLRVLRFMARVPALPWCMQKLLLRKAMAGRLPTAVLERPKETLAAHPVDAFLAHAEPDWWTARLERAPAIERFISRGDFLRAVDEHLSTGRYDVDWLLRPIYLANWLRQKGLG